MIKEVDPDLTSAEVWANISQNCKDIINDMLRKDPKERITVDAAL
jgi:serine/threonine protein kinase